MPFKYIYIYIYIYIYTCIYIYIYIYFFFLYIYKLQHNGYLQSRLWTKKFSGSCFLMNYYYCNYWHEIQSEFYDFFRIFFFLRKKLHNYCFHMFVRLSVHMSVCLLVRRKKSQCNLQINETYHFVEINLCARFWQIYCWIFAGICKCMRFKIFL